MISDYAPLAYIFSSGMGFSVCSLCVKLLFNGGYRGISEIILCRAIIQTISSFVIILCSDSKSVGGCRQIFFYIFSNRRTFVVLIFRGLFAAIAITCSFNSIQRIPLGDSSVLVMLNTVFGSIGSYVILGEPWRASERLATLIALSGATLIARPTFLFQGQKSNLDPIGAIYGILAGLFMGLGFVLVRLLGTSAKTPWPIICLVQGVIQFLFSSLSMLILGERILINIPMLQLLTIIFTASLGTLCLIGTTVGIQKEKGALGMSMRISEVLFGFVWQILFTTDSINVLSLLGACLITASVLITLCVKRNDVKSFRSTEDIASPESDTYRGINSDLFLFESSEEGPFDSMSAETEPSADIIQFELVSTGVPDLEKNDGHNAYKNICDNDSIPSSDPKIYESYPYGEHDASDTDLDSSHHNLLTQSHALLQPPPSLSTRLFNLTGISALFHKQKRSIRPVSLQSIVRSRLRSDHAPPVPRPNSSFPGAQRGVDEGRGSGEGQGQRQRSAEREVPYDVLYSYDQVDEEEYSEGR